MKYAELAKELRRFMRSMLFFERRPASAGSSDMMLWRVRRGFTMVCMREATTILSALDAAAKEQSIE